MGQIQNPQIQKKLSYIFCFPSPFIKMLTRNFKSGLRKISHNIGDQVLITCQDAILKTEIVYICYLPYPEGNSQIKILM